MNKFIWLTVAYVYMFKLIDCQSVQVHFMDYTTTEVNIKLSFFNDFSLIINLKFVLFSYE